MRSPRRARAGWALGAALPALLANAGARAAVIPPAPVAAVHDVTDDYLGTRITDPYRWMESEPEPQFRDYLHAENDHARAVLATIPGRDALAAAIGKVSGLATRVRSVALAGGRIFFLRREAGGQIDRLTVQEASGAQRVLVDPSSLGKDGAHAEIDQFVPSDDGSLVVYGISMGGSENSTLHVIDVATGTIHPDSIDRAQFASASWAPDGKSFFYTRLPAGAASGPSDQAYAHQRVLHHILGTDPATDTVVLDADHLPFPFHGAAAFPSVSLTPGSATAIALVSDGVEPEATAYVEPVASLLAGRAEWRKLFLPSDDVVSVAVDGDRVDLLTHKDAPRFRIVETSLAAPDFAQAKTVFPQGTGVITGLGAAQDALYVSTRDGAVSTLHRVPVSGGGARTIALPFAGTIDEDGGIVTDPTRSGALIGLESWVHPHLWYAYDPASDRLADTKLIPPYPVDLSPYTSIETTATAADGTKIPLSIVLRKGLARDHRRPTYLVGYGAYGVSYDPSFNPDFLPWLDKGGIYAIAHVRGGGELGQAWHDAGKIATKQNTIHDFISCAERLIAMGWTDPAHLGGEGTSAGGILIGGAITQRPDLFRAALIRVGATNILREQFTPGGPANIPEFGDANNKAQFPAMLAMDAYNNVRKGVKYPAVLLTGGADDPRVTVWIPAKMTAKLQADTASGRPILFRVEFDAGHGIGSTRAQRDDETADEFAFLLWQFGEKGFQPAR